LSRPLHDVQAIIVRTGKTTPTLLWKDKKQPEKSFLSLTPPCLLDKKTKKKNAGGGCKKSAEALNSSGTHLKMAWRRRVLPETDLEALLKFL